MHNLKNGLRDRICVYVRVYRLGSLPQVFTLNSFRPAHGPSCVQQHHPGHPIPALRLQEAADSSHCAVWPWCPCRHGSPHPGRPAANHACMYTSCDFPAYLTPSLFFRTSERNSFEKCTQLFCFEMISHDVSRVFGKLIIMQATCSKSPHSYNTFIS